MIFLESLFINTIAFIIAFLIIKLIINHNKKLFLFIDYFNIYGTMSFLVSLFYLKISNKSYIVIEVLLIIVLSFFYLRSFDSANNKFKDRFKIIVLSFGHSKKTFFREFLSKKLIIRGIESYLFGVGIYYLLIIFFSLAQNSIQLKYIIIPTILFFFAAILKSSKINKTYSILK
ncbi:hypothetical protein [Petrotoga sp. 9PWA.NaAc.5.4]|uniref:hypothetical protein n=1 Tax=Petrotoga sp. 9PWA.NaAc.5.4 TaxID=1434328 RepID=UPI000CA8A516|nr:hypothetical protein [Petrotoga sp. 9PWA.NaAc.5.4]PNR95404.1 hypothetical protein X924_05015 [Petrotoga sp. 9PWA.NaAc.5.4]